MTSRTYINKRPSTITVEGMPIEQGETFEITEKKQSQEIKNLISNNYISEVKKK